MGEEFIPQMAKRIIITSLNEEWSAVVKIAFYWKADRRRVHPSDGKKNHYQLTE